MFSQTYIIITPCNNTNYCGQRTHTKSKIDNTSNTQKTHKLRLLRKGK